MNKNILIVDDDEAILEVLKLIAETADYNVQTATSGEEALIIVENNQPDLMILDMLLPGISGKQVCKKIKSDQKTKKIPIIMISANIKDEEFRKNPWAEEFLEKPVDMDKFLNVIAGQLEKAEVII